MRNSRALSLLLSVPFAVTLWSHPANAETIEITNGGVSELGLSFEFPWTNYSLFGLDSSFSGYVCCGITATIPPFGGETSLSGGANLEFGVPTIAPSMNVVHGTPITAFVSGGLTFTAPPITLPPPTLGTMWQFSSPFTATGHIVGTSSDHGPEVFAFDLVGGGTGTISGNVVNPSEPRYNPLILTYRFDSAAPTPEPEGVWLLLASGFVAALYRGIRAMVV